MKLGVFGGTFSPPHKGHVAAAVCFKETFGLDRLLIVPAAVAPNKEGKDVLPALHRVAMCRLAFDGIPSCEVSEIELARGGTSYTYLTLGELSSPDVELYLLMGSDMFLTLGSWRRPEELLRLSTVVVAGRVNDPGTLREMEKTREELLSKYGGKIAFLENPVVEVSSTFLREKIAAGEDTGNWLTAPVREYIEKEKLYDDN